MNRYAQDPRWLIARYDSVCQCGRPVKRGGQIFYYPKSKTALCCDEEETEVAGPPR